MKRFTFTQERECTVWEKITYEVEAPCRASARKLVEENPWDYETETETLYETMEYTGNDDPLELESEEKID